MIVTQLATQRSQHSLFFAVPFSIFLWTNGVSRQTIEALYKCGLSISFTSLSTLLNRLSIQCLERAFTVGRGPHMLCYDNINISMSIHVEQRAFAPAKVQSGTFAVLYEVHNGNLKDMALLPIIQRAQQVSSLTFNADVRPTHDQSSAFRHQLQIHVIDILLECCSHFKSYSHRADPLLKYLERQKISKGHRTKQYPLRTSTIEESSVTGNIAVIHDVYINQLNMTHNNFSNIAIPSINDQSTNARIRGAKALRAKDVNPFTRLQFLQLSPGLFHLGMNLIWVLLHVHRGSINQPGSLAYFFALLDRSRLSCEHPDYHALLSTFFQILKGIILNAWRVECGAASLASFASSEPSPAQLLGLADKILQLHAMPPSEPPLSKKQQQSQMQQVDYANRNLKILTRDLLYVLELVEACADGDFGRVEDILGSLAMIFRGARSNNYCSEILHFVYNLRKVWTPEFGCVCFSIVFTCCINSCYAEISCAITCL